MVVCEGETTIEVPVPIGVVQQEAPSNQVQVPPEPKTPPVIDNVVGVPAQKLSIDLLITLGDAGGVSGVIEML